MFSFNLNQSKIGLKWCASCALLFWAQYFDSLFNMKLSWGNSKYVTNQITSRLRLAECWRRLWSASKQPPLLCTTLSWRLQPLLLWMLLLLFSCNNCLTSFLAYFGIMVNHYSTPYKKNINLCFDAVTLLKSCHFQYFRQMAGPTASQLCRSGRRWTETKTSSLTKRKLPIT